MGETIGKLTPELYWEWRTSAAELNVAKGNKLEQELKYQMMQKDIEIYRLRTMLFVPNIDLAKSRVSDAQTEYDLVKKKIEDFMGKPMLEGYIINDNLEVIKLDEQLENIKK